MPGGLFTIAPLTLAALACPFLYRRMRKAGRTNTWLLLTSSLALGLLLVVIDSRMAGLGWRYIADFGWLFALAALPSALGMSCRIPRAAAVHAGCRADVVVPARA